MAIELTSPSGCVGQPYAPGALPLYPALLGGVRPSGDVPTTGAPAVSFPAGNWAFHTNIQVVGADPTIDPSGFGAAFAVAAEELAGVNVQSVSIRKGPQTNQAVPRVEGLLQHLPGASLASRDIPSWWIEIDGQINSRNGFETDKLNQAISRALASSTRWTGYAHEDWRSKIPRDGGQLWGRFRASNACTGGATYTDVMARACTRIGAPGSVPSAPPSATPPASQSSAPQTAPSATRPDCAVRVASPFWLRPTQTFERTGPQYPAGTAVTITGDAITTQGSLALFPVSVAGRMGYAALSERDMVGCTTFRHPAAARPTSTSPRPVAQATLSRPGTSAISPVRATMLAPPAEDDSSAWKWGLGALFVATVAGTAVVKRKEISAYFSSKRSATHTTHHARQ